MQIIPDLTSFPLICIYALIDRGSNALFPLFSSGNSLNQLSLHVTRLRRGIHDCKLLQDAYNRGYLELKVFKSYESIPNDLVIRAEAASIFNKSGYTDMTGFYTDMRYSIHTSVMLDYRALRSTYPLVYVTLKSRSLEALVIGVFDSMIEADEWLSMCYPGGDYTQIVFCTNELTKGYHDDKGYKLIRFREKQH